MFNFVVGLVLLGSLIAMSDTTCTADLSSKVVTALTRCLTNTSACQNGTQINQEINECSSNPCQNGATCNDELSNYNCACVSGYTGKNCHIALPLQVFVSNGYLYWVTSNGKSWQESRDECQAMGGDLASVGIKTANERRNLKQSLSMGSFLHWLGGDDLQVEGIFRWLDGTLVSSNEWDSGEPNGGTTQNYLCMFGASNRNALHSCYNTRTIRAICSKRQPA